MKMKTLIVLMAACLCLSVLSGCGGNNVTEKTAAPAEQEAEADEKSEEAPDASAEQASDVSAGQEAEADEKSEEAPDASAEQASDVSAEQGAQADATAGEEEAPGTEAATEAASEAASEEVSLAETAQEAQAGATAGRAVVSGDDKSGVWNIPVSGMDITLPESWKSSDCYLSYRATAIQPDLVLTSCLVYAATEEELETAVGRLGEESQELREYLDERINDMFIILSVSDILSKRNVMELIEQDDRQLSFDLEEIGKADGWTFYNVVGEEVLRRPVPPEDRAEDIEAFIADLPELFENIRFYEPKEEPSTKAGSVISFETVDFDGNKVDSRELFAKNRYTMINLWMSWCTYCVEEMPALEKMNKEFAEDGGAVIGVMLDGDMEKELEIGKEIRDETGVTYPILIPTARMKEQLIAKGYPTTFFVDSNGIVVGDPVIGMYPDEYRERMEELLAGNPSEAATEEEE